MKRPSPAGLLIVAAFAIPILVELRTVLVWLGFDVPLDLYVVASVLLVVAVIAGIWVLGEPEGNPSRA